MNSRPPFEAHRQDLDKVLRILQDTPALDREYMAPLEEFQARVRRTNQTLQKHGHTVGLVFSDEHYAGDVPYLGGNTNISIEQVAGVIGPLDQNAGREVANAIAVKRADLLVESGLEAYFSELQRCLMAVQRVIHTLTNSLERERPRDGNAMEVPHGLDCQLS